MKILIIVGIVIFTTLTIVAVGCCLAADIEDEEDE